MTHSKTPVENSLCEPQRPDSWMVVQCHLFIVLSHWNSCIEQLKSTLKHTLWGKHKVLCRARQRTSICNSITLKPQLRTTYLGLSRYSSSLLLNALSEELTRPSQSGNTSQSRIWEHRKTKWWLYSTCWVCHPARRYAFVKTCVPLSLVKHSVQ